MTYSEKLKDPRWQKKRLEVLNRDQFKCRCCDGEKRTLHVHHIHYTNEPWDSELLDLVTLCDVCHKEWHRIYDKSYSDTISMIVNLYDSIETESIKQEWQKDS